MRSKKLLFVLMAFSAASAAMLCGCNAPKDQLQTFNRYYEAGDSENAILFADKLISKKPTPKGQDLLWSLQVASVERMVTNYTASNEYFDRAEDMVKHYDLSQSGVVDSAASVAVNENAIPYTGHSYDEIMLNTYKALNFAAQGNMDLARVEFNRALDRQRRAKEKYNAEIKKLQAEIDAAEAENQNSTTQQSIDNPEVARIIEQNYPNLNNFAAYPDFINPFTTATAGVFFNFDKDHSKAVDLLKETLGMVPDNQYIAEELARTELILSGRPDNSKFVWVIFENGLGPVKEETRIDLPLFIATDNVRYVGIALPKLSMRSGAYPHISAKASGKTYQTEVVADMDRVVQTEFNKDFPGILTRAIISTTAKAVAQYALEKQGSSGSSLAAIAMAAYSFATTAADVRMWTTLPKDFQLARLPAPADGTVVIEAPSVVTEPLTLSIDPAKNVMIFIKIIRPDTQPFYDIIEF